MEKNAATTTEISTRKSHGVGAALRRRVRGAALLEMGILLGLIAIVSIGAVVFLGRETEDVFCSANGAMDAAMGGDGYCLGEATGSSAPPPALGEGFENGDFTDVLFAQGTTGSPEIMLPLSEAAPKGMSFMVEPAPARAFEACYRMTPGSETVCQAYANGKSLTAVPAGAWMIGYRPSLPENISDIYEVPLALTFGNAATTIGRWNVAVVREPFYGMFAPEMTFDDQSYPEKTIGTQTIMVPLAGHFDSDLEFSILPGDTLAYGVCTWSSEGSDPVCQDASRSATKVIFDADEVYAVGYRFALPTNAGETVREELGIRLALALDTTVNERWTVAIDRVASVEPFLTPYMLGDVTFAAGTTGADHYIWTEMGEGFPYNIRVGTNSVDPINLQPCVLLTEGGAPVCDWGWESGVKTITGAGNAYAFGFRVNLDTVSPFEDLSHPVIVALSQAADNDRRQDWQFNIIRPAQEVVFEPSLDVPDIALAKGDNTANLVTFPLDGNFVGNLEFSTDGGGVVGLQPCRRDPDAAAPSSCLGLSETRSGWQGAWPGMYELGYQVTLGASLFQDFDQDVTFTIRSKVDSQQSQDYTFNVSRPADAAVITVDNVFADVTTEVEHSTSETLLQAFAGSTNADLRLIASSTGPILVTPCVKANSVTSRCGDFASTSNELVLSRNENDYLSQVGYRTSWAQATPNILGVESTITLRFEAAENAAYGVEKTFTITRPDNSPVFTISATDLSSVAPAGSRSVETHLVTRDADTNWTVGAHLYTNGKDVLRIRPCYQEAEGAALTCGPWSTGVEDVSTGGVVPYAIGHQVDWSFGAMGAAPVTSDLVYDAVYAVQAQGLASQQFDITAERPAGAVAIVVNNEFPDVTVPVNYATSDTVLQAFDGSKNTGMTIVAESTGPILVTPCIKRASAATRCGDFASNPASLELTSTENNALEQIGYRTSWAEATPNTLGVESTITLHFEGTGAPGSGVSKTFKITRPDNSPVFTVSAADLAHVAPAGSRSIETHLVERDGDTDWTVGARFYTNGKDALMMRPCYQATEGATLSCGAWGTGVNDVNSGATVPHAFGYQVDWSYGAAGSAPVTSGLVYNAIYAANPVGMASIQHDITATRPAATAQMTYSFDFDDDLYAVGTTNTSPVMQDLAGTSNAQIDLMAIYDGNARIRACWQYLNAAVNCASGWGSGNVTTLAPQDTSGRRLAKVGYEADFSQVASTSAASSNATIRVSATVDAAQSFEDTFLVNRPAAPPAFSVSGADFSHAFPATAGGIERFMVYNDGSKWTVPVRFYTAGQNTLRMRPCYQDTPSSEVVCKAAFSTGVDWIQNSAGVVPYAIGYEVDFSNKAAPGTALNLAVRIAVHKYGSSSGTAYDITVSRPAN